MKFWLALCLIPGLLTACSRGGADDRYYYPPDNPTNPSPNPLPSSDPYAGGCAGASAIEVNSTDDVCVLVNMLGTYQDNQDWANELAIQRPWWEQGGAAVGTVQLYQECTSNNAFSTPNFNIAFGTRMYEQLRVQYGSMIGITVVLAHEWGHQIQFRHDYFTPKVPTRTTELEADLIAGFYVGWARTLSQSDLGQVLDVLHGLGDELYNDPSHHGTPPERKFMELWGYAMAKNAQMQGQMVTWDDLHNEARKQIGSMAALRASGIDGEQLVDIARHALKAQEGARE